MEDPTAKNLYNHMLDLSTCCGCWGNYARKDESLIWDWAEQHWHVVFHRDVEAGLEVYTPLLRLENEELVSHQTSESVEDCESSEQYAIIVPRLTAVVEEDVERHRGNMRDNLGRASRIR